LARVEWIGLPNLIAGRAVVPELIQEQVTGERLAREIARLLDDPVAATAQRAAVKELRARLGGPGVGRPAPPAVLAPPRRPRRRRSRPRPRAPRARPMKVPPALALALGPTLGAGALRALVATLHVRREEDAVAALWAARAPVIYAVWHGRVLLLPRLYGR